MNSLDPKARRLRGADKSLQQARNALQGAQIVLADIPHSNASPLASALEAINNAMQRIDDAAASLDDARMEEED